MYIWLRFFLLNVDDRVDYNDLKFLKFFRNDDGL